MFSEVSEAIPLRILPEHSCCTGTTSWPGRLWPLENRTRPAQRQAGERSWVAAPLTRCSLLAWTSGNCHCHWSKAAGCSDFLGGAVVMSLPAITGDGDPIPGLGRSPGEGNGNPLQYSCLENPTGRGAWYTGSMGSQRVGHDCATNTLGHRGILHRALSRPELSNMGSTSHMLFKLRRIK